jgi:hypothetical protein
VATWKLFDLELLRSRSENRFEIFFKPYQVNFFALANLSGTIYQVSGRHLLFLFLG